MVIGLAVFAAGTLQVEGASNAFTAFLTEVSAFIPNVVGAAIVLLVGYLVVRAAVGALRVGMRRAKLEGRINETGLGRAIERSGSSLSNIVVLTVKWILYLVVVAYAVIALGVSALTASMLGVLAWIPNLVGVAIIVFVGALAASYVGKALETALPRYGVTGGRIIGLVVEFLIYALVFDFALIQIGFGAGIIYTMTTAFAWGLAAAMAIGFGVSIAYALRGVMTSMLTGATTLVGALKEGQRISVEGIQGAGNDAGRVTGTVRSVGMFSTVLQRDGNGNGFLIVPNGMLMDKPISVEGDEVPRLVEEKIRDRMSNFNRRYEGHMGSVQEVGTVSPPNAGQDYPEVPDGQGVRDA
jgi:Conserved TM helix